MIVTRLGLFCLLFFAICNRHSAGQEQVVFGEFGFKIAGATDEWSLQKPDTGKPGSKTVKIRWRGSAGSIEFTVIADQVSEDVDPELRRDASFAKTDGRSEFTNKEKQQVQTAHGRAPGFEVDWTINGETYRVRQCYLFNQDTLYTLAVHAPVDDFDKYEDRLMQLLKSFRFVTLTNKQKLARHLKVLAAKCGDELSWEASWKSAAERAEVENKCLLVLLPMQTGFVLTDTFKAGPLMDQNVIDLLNEYCIALQYRKGMEAAINEYKNYGIGPSSFGYTILLVEPDGEVIGDTFIQHTGLFYDFLLQHLVATRPEIQPPADLSGLELANWHTRCGRLEAALKILDGQKEELSAQALMLRASIFARQMKGDLAIAALDQSSAATNDEELMAETELFRAMIGLGAESVSAESALVTFQSFQRKYPKNDLAPEAMYWLGACQLAQSKGAETASSTWNSLIKQYPTSRWAVKSAATLLSSSMQLGIEPQFAWPDAEVVEALRFQSREALAVEGLERARSDAIVYLMDKQLPDGSWISPPDALKAKGYSTSHFTAAVTSICARSLLPHRDDKEIRSAIKKSVDYLLLARKQRRQVVERPILMDYSAWGDSYSLIFLAEAIESKVVELEAVKWLTDDLIATLKSNQKRGGGWNYLVSYKLEVRKPGNSSCSFMTATVAIALMRARDAGIAVPNSVIERAVACLQEARHENLTYDYFLFHEIAMRTETGVEGAAGRGPLCSLALMLGGRGNVSEIEKCVDLFVTHSANYVRETGKSLMHAAPGSQGSHYLMFDYDWAAQALAELPAEAQAKYRTQLIEMVLSARSQQGAYHDNPINGWHYGTGMALHALNVLSTEK